MRPVAATQLLRDQHKTIRGLFRQLQAVDSRAPEMKDGVVRETLMQIEVHLRLEEEFLFPPLLEAQAESVRESAAECLSDHREVKGLVRAARKRPPGDEFFNTGLESLTRTVEEHFADEDERLYGLAEKTLGSLLDEMGPRIEERRDELMRAPEYLDALPEVVQNPNGGEQMRKKSA